MDHDRDPVTDIQGKDVDVELGCNDDVCDSSTLLILHLDDIHHILGHLVDWLA